MKRLSLGALAMTFLLLAACNAPAPAPTATLEPAAPGWQPLGGVLDVTATDTSYNPSLVVDNAGNPTVAWQEEVLGESNNIYVKRWNGSSWQQLGGALDITITDSSVAPSLALDSSGNPTVSFSNGVAYVKRWNGTTWVQLGTQVNSPFNAGQSPSLALDSSGAPVVAFSEGVNNRDIFVRRWNGTTWVQLGGGLGVNGPALAEFPSLAIDPSGNPVVSWEERDGTSALKDIYVKRWNGSSWIQLGDALDVNVGQSANYPSLALDSSGNPIVSWQEVDLNINNSWNIYVKRWNGTAWVQLGGALDITIGGGGAAVEPSLAVNSSGNPVVSWQDNAYGYVKRWTGSSWVQLAGPLLRGTDFFTSASLDLDPSGNPVVASSERNSSYDIFVQKYVTNVFQPLGDTLDTIASQNATNASITRKSNNNPVVAWQEFDGTSKNVYVKEWTGSAWSAVGGALDKFLADNTQNPSIAMRTDNRPTVAFEGNNSVSVKRWNDVVWVRIGAELDTVLANVAVTPSLALDSTNLAVVAFVESNSIFVKKANGILPSSVWTSPYGTTPLDINAANVASRPSLALKSDNNPVVAWYENDGVSTNIYVKEWNGSSWVQLGSTLDMVASQNAKDVVLAIRTDNRPVVAWEEVGNIYVKQWNGSAWQSIGGVLDKVPATEALRPALDLRSDNNPIVTWQEGSSSNYNVYVKRWVGTLWANISISALDKNLGQTAQRPVIILKSFNNPVVAWDESDGTSTNILVKEY